MLEPPSETSTPGYKDRRTGLSCFGILVIVLGGLTALMAPLTLLSVAVAAQTTGASTFGARQVAFSAAVYLAIGAVLVWLGIGSILARKWARALLLVLSSYWLVAGIVFVGLMALLLPGILAQAGSGDARESDVVRWVTTIFVLGFLGVFFVLIPGVLVLFYRRSDVKQTCEARDPVFRWTDACPLPLLALSLLLGWTAVMMPFALISYSPVALFFGALLTGVKAALVMLTFSIVLGYGAWALYRRSLVGWWVAFIAYGLFLISTVLTLARVDLIEMYRLMGYPEAHLELLQEMRWFRGGTFTGAMIVFALSLFGYMIYAKRYVAGAVSRKGPQLPG